MKCKTCGEEFNPVGRWDENCLACRETGFGAGGGHYKAPAGVLPTPTTDTIREPAPPIHAPLQARALLATDGSAVESGVKYESAPSAPGVVWTAKELNMLYVVMLAELPNWKQAEALAYPTGQVAMELHRAVARIAEFAEVVVRDLDEMLN